jgi:hypothetical protein
MKPKPNLNKKIVWSSLFFITILVGVVRYGLLDVPLERDEGEYAYAAQLVLKGIPPYQEVSNMKLPGIYAAYASILAFFGQTHQGIHFGLLIINSITIVMVFFLAKHLINPLGAVASAASFALLSVSYTVEGVFANAEHFVILFSTAGLLVMLKSFSGGRICSYFVSGILLGLGFIMKQHGAAFIILALLYMVICFSRQHVTLGRGLMLRLTVFSAGWMTVFGFVGLFLFYAGVFSSFWFWTVDYALTYISQVPLEIAWRGFITRFTAIVSSAPYLWILIASGIFAVPFVKNITRQKKIFLMMFAGFSILSVCPGFYFRPHYFILLLPSASLFAGLSIGALSDNLLNVFSGKIKYTVPIMLLLICLSQAVYKQFDYMFKMTPFQVSRLTYWPNPFPESIKIAEFINNNTSPADYIAVLGSEPQIYFYSKRSSAVGYFYMYPLTENHEFASWMQKDFLNDIERKKPKYLVFVSNYASWGWQRNSCRKIIEWFNEKQKGGSFRIVGLVESFEDKVLYHWEPLDASKIENAKFWIVILERIE